MLVGAGMAAWPSSTNSEFVESIYHSSPARSLHHSRKDTGVVPRAYLVSDSRIYMAIKSPLTLYPLAHGVLSLSVVPGSTHRSTDHG